MVAKSHKIGERLEDKPSRLDDKDAHVLADGPLRFVDDLEALLGEVHGMARTTHVRTAIKTLYKQGIIDSDGTGDFFMTAIALVE